MRTSSPHPPLTSPTVLAPESLQRRGLANIRAFEGRLSLLQYRTSMPSLARLPVLLVDTRTDTIDWERQGKSC